MNTDGHVAKDGADNPENSIGEKMGLVKVLPPKSPQRLKEMGRAAGADYRAKADPDLLAQFEQVISELGRDASYKAIAEGMEPGVEPEEVWAAMVGAPPTTQNTKPDFVSAFVEAATAA